MPPVSDKYRRINIGFKPEGADPDQDKIFEILQVLDKKGAKARFITMTILEYLEVHQGVIGSESMGTVLVISQTKGNKKARDSPAHRIRRATNLEKQKEAVQASAETDFSALPSTIEDVLLKSKSATTQESMEEQDNARINDLLNQFLNP